MNDEIGNVIQILKETRFTLREAFGIPTLRGKLPLLMQNLNSHERRGETHRSEKAPIGSKKVPKKGAEDSTFSNSNSNHVSPNPPPLTLQTRFSSGTLMPIRTSLSNLLESASDVNRMKAQAELLEKQKQLEEEEKKRKKEDGFHLRRQRYYE